MSIGKILSFLCYIALWLLLGKMGHGIDSLQFWGVAALVIIIDLLGGLF